MRAFRLLISAAVLAVAACGGDVRRYAEIDAAQKVMIVAPGGGLLGEVKDMLRAEGWRLLAGRATHVSADTTGPLQPDVPARYRLILRYNRVDTCITSGRYTYDLSVIDLQSGAEVLTLSGHECGQVMITRLRDALRARK